MFYGRGKMSHSFAARRKGEPRVVLVVVCEGRRWEVVAALSEAPAEAARLLSEGAATVRCYEGRRLRWERKLGERQSA